MTAHERLVETLEGCNQHEAVQYIRELRAENIALDEEAGVLRAERDQLRGALEQFREATDRWWERVKPEEVDC